MMWRHSRLLRVNGRAHCVSSFVHIGSLAAVDASFLSAPAALPLCGTVAPHTGRRLGACQAEPVSESEHDDSSTLNLHTEIHGPHHIVATYIHTCMHTTLTHLLTPPLSTFRRLTGIRPWGRSLLMMCRACRRHHPLACARHCRSYLPHPGECTVCAASCTLHFAWGLTAGAHTGACASHHRATTSFRCTTVLGASATHRPSGTSFCWADL
jgi:hypothetical protein